MTPLERHTKKNELITKFKNGEKRYQESALFNRVIQMLVRDADVYEIIGQLINVAEDSQKALGEHLAYGSSPRYVPLDSLSTVWKVLERVGFTRGVEFEDSDIENFING